MGNLGMDAGNGFRIGKMLIGEDGKLGLGIGDYPVELDGEYLDSLLLLGEGLGLLILELSGPDLLLLGHAALAVKLGVGGAVDELGIGAGSDVDVIGMIAAEGFGFEAVEGDIFFKDMGFEDFGIGGDKLATQAHIAVGDGIRRAVEVAGGCAEAGGGMGEPLKLLVVDNALGVVVEAEGLLTAGLAADGAEEALDDAECLGRASAALLEGGLICLLEFFYRFGVVQGAIGVRAMGGITHGDLLGRGSGIRAAEELSAGSIYMYFGELRKNSSLGKVFEKVHEG